MPLKGTRQYVHVEGKMKELVEVHDESGTLMHKVLKPVMVQFHLHDVVQVIVGATLLAIPVGLTEEVWRLGESLDWWRVILLVVASVGFIGLFTYYTSYQEHLGSHWLEFFKRLIGTYVIALAVGFLFLLVIDKAPLDSSVAITFKRIIIVGFPASLSAAVVDLIK